MGALAMTTEPQTGSVTMLRQPGPSPAGAEAPKNATAEPVKRLPRQAQLLRRRLCQPVSLPRGVQNNSQIENPMGWRRVCRPCGHRCYSNVCRVTPKASHTRSTSRADGVCKRSGCEQFGDYAA